MLTNANTNTTASLTTTSITREEKEKIFEIKKYTFLKRKRKEIVDHYHKSHPWSNEEDGQLKDLLYSFTSLSWKFISSKLKERSPSQCMHHWNRNLNPNIKKGKWSKEEDDIVMAYVKENGTNWGELQLYLQGRTTKQIRERWVNYLSKDTTEFKWNRELDKMLIEQYILLGSAWVKISARINRTTENMVKNRFYGLLRACVAKCKKSNKGVSDKVKMIKEELDKSYNKKNGGGLEKEVKLSDFNMGDMDMAMDIERKGEGKEGCVIDRIVNNPYLSKKKNYSLRILIEFLPVLIDELGIDLETLNHPRQSIENNGNGNADVKSIDNEEYINIFSNKEDSIDLFNTNSNNTLDNINESYNDYTFDKCNNDDDSTNANPSSKLTHRLNSLTTVFNNYDKQLLSRFFESFRNKALCTLFE